MPTSLRAPIASSDPQPSRRIAGIPLTTALLTIVALVAVSGVAASVAPGQRIANYVAAHARLSDRAQLRGVAIEDATAVVLTRLPRTDRSRLAALRLCVVATAAVHALRVRAVSRVAVTDRGDRNAAGDYVPLVVTEQVGPRTECVWQ